MKLKKSKGTILVLSGEYTFEDTYNEVHASEKWLDSLNLKIGDIVTKEDARYGGLISHFELVNYFIERIEVPNKKVISEVLGTSKLIRNSERTQIEIAYRRKNKSGKLENSATSPNICFISNADREKFFTAVKRYGKVIPGKYNSKYILTAEKNQEVFELWQNKMDKTYELLSGIIFTKKREINKTFNSAGAANKALSAWYPSFDSSKYINILERLGFCKTKLNGVFKKSGKFVEYRHLITSIDILSILVELDGTELDQAIDEFKKLEVPPCPSVPR